MNNKDKIKLMTAKLGGNFKIPILPEKYCTKCGKKLKSKELKIDVSYYNENIGEPRFRLKQIQVCPGLHFPFMKHSKRRYIFDPNFQTHWEEKD